jgi:hypothetical protein
VLTDDWLEVRPNGASALSVSIDCPIKMLGRAVWIQENTRRFHATVALGFLPSDRLVLCSADF